VPGSLIGQERPFNACLINGLKPLSDALHRKEQIPIQAKEILPIASSFLVLSSL
jgi:hypothetical protein